jgi:aspartate racemase
MKTLALLGGMSYHATAIYYSKINTLIQEHYGDTTCASLLIHSFNHAETQKLFNSGQWDKVADKFSLAGSNLKNAGADGLMICCNIGHKVAEEVEKRSGMPLLHIADGAGEQLQEAGVKKVALIGTKPVMQEAFLKQRLIDGFGVEVVVPESSVVHDDIHNLIMKELARNIVTPESRDFLLNEIRKLIHDGAGAVLLACTELQIIVKAEDLSVPLFDTMDSHIAKAVKWILEHD